LLKLVLSGVSSHVTRVLVSCSGMFTGNMGGFGGGGMKMEGGNFNMGGGMRGRMNNPNYTAF